LTKVALETLAANGRAAELGRFLEWCERRPPPAQPDELPGSEDPHAVACFYPRFVARLAAGPNGPEVLRTLLAFDKRRADAGKLDDPSASPRSAASILFWTSAPQVQDEVAAALVAALAPPACLEDYLTSTRELDPLALPFAALAALQEAAAMATAGPAAVADALPPLAREALAAVEGCGHVGEAALCECLEAAAAVAMAACDAATAEAVLRAASRPAAVRHLKAAAAPLDGASVWDCLGALAGQGGGGGGGGGVSTRGASRARALHAQLAARQVSLAKRRGGKAEALQALLQAGLVDRAEDLAAAMPRQSVKAAAARALGALQPGGRWVEHWAVAGSDQDVTSYSEAQGSKLGLLHSSRCAGCSPPAGCGADDWQESVALALQRRGRPSLPPQSESV
jgi:hypothetical protein